MPGPMQLDATRRLVVESARRNAEDSYLAALLQPRRVRGDLIVLAAFEGELDRIPREVSEPMLADIRLQWWYDWISDLAPGRSSGAPIADALAEVVLRHDLDREALAASVLARSADDAFPPGGGAPSVRLRGLGRAAPAMWRVACVLGQRTAGPSDNDYVTQAGLALDAVREGMRLQARRAHHAAAEPAARAEIEMALSVSRHALAAARRLAPAASATVRRASLPVALVGPYLRALQEAADDPGRPVADILPLTRVWRLGVSRFTGSF